MASPLVRVVMGVLCLPLLVLLHVAFVLSSLALRLSELFFKAPAAPSRNTDPPRHVAFVFKSSSRLSGAENGRRLVESSQRAVRWAAQSGVRDLSIYTGQGASSISTLSVLWWTQEITRGEMGRLMCRCAEPGPLAERRDGRLASFSTVVASSFAENTFEPLTACCKDKGRCNDASHQPRLVPSSFSTR